MMKHNNGSRRANRKGNQVTRMFYGAGWLVRLRTGALGAFRPGGKTGFLCRKTLLLSTLWHNFASNGSFLVFYLRARGRRLPSDVERKIERTKTGKPVYDNNMRTRTLRQ